MTGLDRIIENALMEDIHTGDITTQAVVREGRRMRARLKAKEEMLLAGETLSIETDTTWVASTLPALSVA